MAKPAAAVYRELYYSQYELFPQLAGLFYATNRTIDSYFWEARRIMGFDEALAPRSAFIRAVAGQSPKGYERAVLERGEAPAGLVEGVREVVSGRGPHSKGSYRHRAQAARRCIRLCPSLRRTCGWNGSQCSARASSPGATWRARARGRKGRPSATSSLVC